MNAELDIWILLFVAAAAQGFFLFFLLMANQKKKNNHNGYLAGLILSFTLTLSYYITFWTNVSNSLPRVFAICMFLTFLFGPLLIGYLSKVKSGVLPKYWHWHFAPFGLILMMILLVEVKLLSVSTEQSASIFSYVNYAQNLHLVIYSAWALSLGKAIRSTSWGFKVALAFSGYTLCFLTYYVLVWTGVMELQYDYIVSLGMTSFIYFLGYHGFKSPEVLYRKAPALKYEKSSLTEQALIALEKKMDGIMMEERLFTNGDLKLQDLSDKIGISPNDISQTINVTKGQKFTDYLNDLRVNEAIELMHSDEYRECKLLAVAIDSGFNNKTSFLNAFKKKHGISPSEYRKQIHLKAS